MLSRRQWLVALGGLTTAAVVALVVDSQDATTPRPEPSAPDRTTSFGALPRRGRPTAQGADGELSATINAAGGRVVLPAGRYQFYNFADPPNYPVYGLYLRPQVTGLVGAGIGRTVLEMHPASSTKARAVPRQSAGGTNQLSLLRTDAASLADFTLLGTEQGHLYNGLVVYRGRRLAVTDVLIKGVPGSNPANPGETFSINLYQDTDSVLTRVEVDGRDAAGQRVAASGIGANYSHGLTTTDCYSHDLAFGSGITHYQLTGTITHTNFRSIGNVLPFNHEGCTATFVYRNPIAQRNRSMSKSDDPRPVFGVFDSDRGDSRVLIYDPLIDDGHGNLVTPSPSNPLTVVIHARYGGGPNRQRASSIHLVLSGMDRTADCLRVAGDETLPRG